MLQVGLAAPHVARWWREPSTSDHVERAHGPYADGTARDAALFVLLQGGEPVGLFQRYRHRDHPDRATAAGQPDAVRIDYLIGVADRCRWGVGTAAVAPFAAASIAAVPDAIPGVRRPRRRQRRVPVGPLNGRVSTGSARWRCRVAAMTSRPVRCTSWTGDRAFTPLTRAIGS